MCFLKAFSWDDLEDGSFSKLAATFVDLGKCTDPPTSLSVNIQENLAENFTSVNATC